MIIYTLKRRKFMQIIKNYLLKKELKKINNYLYIFLIFIALGLLFIGFGIYENKQNGNQYFYLNDIIENKNNEENVKAYLKIAKAPYSIAKYENEENYTFYIVFDGNYYYIAYLSDEIYEKLNVEGLVDKPNNYLWNYHCCSKFPKRYCYRSIQ